MPIYDIREEVDFFGNPRWRVSPSFSGQVMETTTAVAFELIGGILRVRKDERLARATRPSRTALG